MKNRLLIIDNIEERTLKFVQLNVDSEPLIAIGFGLHGEVLDKVLDHLKIPFEKKTLMDGKDHAAPKGNFYKVTGMGNAFISGDELTLHNIPSIGYGLGLDIEHLEYIKPCLNGYKLNII
ncbi:MAG: hypothetical protein KJ623_04790 [Nanoarchaeota archaeon]|nr:hypothetical protein [Nanoarchaeota archaeon]MBU0963333.1 hypothetical protein [Nanoarchaeota archaeon]